MADQESEERVVAPRLSDPGGGDATRRDRNADAPEAHGAALGILGIDGWFVWRDRRRLRRAADEVTPLTWRGTRNVSLWLVGLAAIACIGVLLLPGPALAWCVAALCIMVLVGWWWDHRNERHVEQTSAER